MNPQAALAALLLVAAPMTTLATPSDDATVDHPDHDRNEPVQTLDAEDEADSQDLTREDLLENRISYDVPSDTWKAYRLILTDQIWNLEDWGSDGGHAELTLFVALDPGPAATPYLQLSFYHEQGGAPATLPFAAPDGEPTVETVELSVDCSANCPESPGGELSFVTGAMDGASSVHLGIPDGELPGDDEEALEQIEQRPVLDEATQHAGEAGVAGTYAHFVGLEGEILSVEAGVIEVEEDHVAQAGPAEALRELAIDVDETVEPRGNGQILAGLAESAGVQEWSLAAQMGERSVDRVGASAETPEDSVGEPPVAYLATSPDGERALLDLDQTFVGVHGPGLTHMATWGWTSANLTEMYGWPQQDFAAASGISLELTDDQVCAEAGLDACLSVPQPR